jgi:hypothetical protein
LRLQVTYGLAEHRHRFAVWAAARASQRGFTTVEQLRAALDATDIRTVLASPATLQLDSAGFDKAHRRWCRLICSALNKRQVPNVTYGRAAKLVAVYLKAMVIMGGDWDTPLGRNIHPPIDRILLKTLASSGSIQSPRKREWRSISWTRLTESEYYGLIEQLREVVASGSPFWAIEEHWQPSDAAEDAL